MVVGPVGLGTTNHCAGSDHQQLADSNHGDEPLSFMETKKILAALANYQLIDETYASELINDL
jgi:hypothetical protein